MLDRAVTIETNKKCQSSGVTIGCLVLGLGFLQNIVVIYMFVVKVISLS